MGRGCNLPFATAACCRRSPAHRLIPSCEPAPLLLGSCHPCPLASAWEFKNIKKGRNKHWGKYNTSSQVNGFYFYVSLKNFISLLHHLFWLFVFHHNKVTTWNKRKNKTKQLSSRAFLGFLFHLKLPQYLELLKMRKNCPFILTESLFQGISIFWWKMVCWHFPSRAFTECTEHSPANSSLPCGWCTSPFRPRELWGCGYQPNPTRHLELGDESRQSPWASHFTDISADVDLLRHFQLFPLPQTLFLIYRSQSALLMEVALCPKSQQQRSTVSPAMRFVAERCYSLGYRTVRVVKYQPRFPERW